MNLIVLLCEGKTDVAFIRKLVTQTEGFIDYKNKLVRELKEPLSSFFRLKYSAFEYENYKIFNRPPLPIIMYMKKGQTEVYLLIYSMDGKDEKKNYLEVINDFKSLASSKAGKGSFAERIIPNLNISIGFLYDSDLRGVEATIEFLKTNFKEVLPELIDINSNGEVIKTEYFKGIGCYIISENDKDTGNLESVLIPIMKKGVSHELLFNNSEEYLNTIKFSRTLTGTEFSDKQKSTIAISGQFYLSGVDNADMIARTSLLDGKMDADAKCTEVREYIKELIRKTKR